MAVTGTYTVGELCTYALRLAGVAPSGEAAAAEDMADAIMALDMLLKAEQPEDAMWLRAAQSVALAADTASYALASPARPLRILNARYKGADGNEIPMERMTREEYDALPVKTVRGIPTQFMVDRQREQMTLYVWPVLASRTTETVELTVAREIADVVLTSDVLDMPGEWYEAAAYSVADRLCDLHGVEGSRRARIAQMAGLKMMQARAQAMPESVFMEFGDG